MLRRIFLFCLFCLSFLMSFAQSGQCYIKPSPPKLELIYTYKKDGTYYPVEVGINKLNELVLSVQGGDCIRLDEFKRTYKQLLLEKSDVLLFRLAPGLIIDSSLEMEAVEELFVELQLLGIDRVLFSANDLFVARFAPNLEGLIYKLNPLNLEALNSKYKNEGLPVRKIEYISKNVSDSLQQVMLQNAKDQGFPPPPPPPPKMFSEPLEAIEFRKKFPYAYEEGFAAKYSELDVYSILINAEGSYNINGKKNISRQDLFLKLKEIDVNMKTFFMLEYAPDATYDMYLNLVMEIAIVVKNTRKQYCEANSLGDYFKLDFATSRQVNARFPLNVIEKRLYFK